MEEDRENLNANLKTWFVRQKYKAEMVWNSPKIMFSDKPQ